MNEWDIHSLSYATAADAQKGERETRLIWEGLGQNVCACVTVPKGVQKQKHWNNDCEDDSESEKEERKCKYIK